MKFKRILLLFLGAQLALLPLLVIIPAKADAFPLHSYASAVVPQVVQATKEAVTTLAPIANEAIQETTKTVSQWIIEQALKAEAFGVNGLNKLSVSINPASIYTFYRKKPYWLPIIGFIGLGAYIYLKNWTDGQKGLISSLHGNLDYDINHINDIHRVLKQADRTAASAISALSYIPAKEQAALSTAGKIGILPILPDRKIKGFVHEFYTEARRILTAAGTSRDIQDIRDLEAIKHKIIKHFSSPLPL